MCLSSAAPATSQAPAVPPVALWMNHRRPQNIGGGATGPNSRRVGPEAVHPSVHGDMPRAPDFIFGFGYRVGGDEKGKRTHSPQKRIRAVWCLSNCSRSPWTVRGHCDLSWVMVLEWWLVWVDSWVATPYCMFNSSDSTNGFVVWLRARFGLGANFQSWLYSSV